LRYSAQNLEVRYRGQYLQLNGNFSKNLFFMAVCHMLAQGLQDESSGGDKSTSSQMRMQSSKQKLHKYSNILHGTGYLRLIVVACDVVNATVDNCL
jgi:hypothetical protein